MADKPLDPKLAMLAQALMREGWKGEPPTEFEASQAADMYNKMPFGQRAAINQAANYAQIGRDNPRGLELRAGPAPTAESVGLVKPGIPTARTPETTGGTPKNYAEADALLTALRQRLMDARVKRPTGVPGF